MNHSNHGAERESLILRIVKIFFTQRHIPATVNQDLRPILIITRR